MTGLYVGTSGWNYPEWKEGFYKGVPRRRWLQHYAEVFSGVEVNATFYRSMKPETLARWRAETPEHFRYSVKGHRVITHIRRLEEVADSVVEQLAGLAPLAGRIAVILWQTTAGLTKDLARLENFARVLEDWADVRHVIEFRNRSWFDDESAACLSRHRLASAISDASRWPRWDVVTTDLAYVRLHGRPQTYASPYSEEELADWAAKVRRWLGDGHEVHVYFDNTMHGAAPRDASRLLELIGVPYG